MLDFARTGMGHRFFEGDLPRLVKAAERIAAALERIAAALDEPVAAGSIASPTTRDGEGS